MSRDLNANILRIRERGLRLHREAVAESCTQTPTE